MQAREVGLRGIVVGGPGGVEEDQVGRLQQLLVEHGVAVCLLFGQAADGEPVREHHDPFVRAGLCDDGAAAV